MANLVEVILKATDKFSGEISDFKTKMGEAEGATGKLKVGASGAFDFIKDHAAGFALSAGTAIAGFAVKAIGNFEDTGVAIANLRTQTGLTADEASRWKEVGDDLGVGADTIAGGMGKLEKALGKNKDAFKDLGLQVTTTKDGQIDANGTFLAAIDVLNGIQDPAKKAEAGARLFGKGWQSMSELIGAGSGELKQALAAVDPAKIFDDAKIKKAQDLRQGFDSIRDAVEQAGLALAEGLAPAIAQAAQLLGDLLNKAQPVFKTMGDIAGADLSVLTSGLKAVKDAADTVDGALKNVGLDGGLMLDVFKGVTDPIGNIGKLKDALTGGDGIGVSIENTGYLLDGTRDATKRFVTEATSRIDPTAIKTVTDAAKDAKQAISDVDSEWRTLKGDLSVEQEKLNIKQAFGDIAQAAKDAYTATATNSGDAGQKQDAFKQKVIDLKNEVIKYGQTVDGLPPSKATEILALIDSGKFSEAQAAIDALTKDRYVSITPKLGQVPRFASGTSNAPGGLALVGEDGPELVDLPGGSSVYTASQTAGMLGGVSPAGGGQTVINVNGADLNQVYAMLRGIARRGYPNPWR